LGDLRWQKFELMNLRLIVAEKFFSCGNRFVFNVNWLLAKLCVILALFAVKRVPQGIQSKRRETRRKFL